MESTWWTQPSQLDADQQQVVALPLEGNHLVVGPPGSGKTNLLILRATYLHRSKIRDTVILTFGRVLREFLASGSENYNFSNEKIQTYVKWATMLLKEHGIAIQETGELPEVREKILQGFRDLLSSGAEISKYDCILIDEAQDYTSEEIEVFNALSKSIFAVGDDKQRIYQSTGALNELGKFCETTPLRFHYRNGVKISRTADGVMGQLDSPSGLEALSQYNEGLYPSSVTELGSLSISEQVEHAIPEIETQLRAYPGEAIGVLCPRHIELAEITKILENSRLSNQIMVQRHSDGYAALDRERPVIVTTLHSAKGLEFRAVHLLGMENIKNFGSSQKRMTFTGITRAKTSLSVYYDRSVPGYLEKGLASVEADVEPPTLDQLFRGGF